MSDADYWYAPNQQCVGIDPASEANEPEVEPEAEPESNPLDAMTKAELVAYATDNGIEVSEAWTKAEIRAAIDAAG